jgi:hypothetical protein
MVVPTVPISTKSIKSIARNDLTKKWLHMVKTLDSFKVNIAFWRQTNDPGQLRNFGYVYVQIVTKFWIDPKFLELARIISLATKCDINFKRYPRFYIQNYRTICWAHRPEIASNWGHAKKKKTVRISIIWRTQTQIRKKNSAVFWIEIPWFSEKFYHLSFPQFLSHYPKRTIFKCL